MKRIIIFGIFFSLNIFYAQKKNVLTVKFNEKFFVSNFMKQRTDNAFVLNLINEADSLALKNLKENYSVLLDSLLKKKSNLSNEELSKMSEKDL